MWCNNNGMCTRTQLCTVRLKRFQFAESCRGWNFPLKLDETRMCAYLSQITFAVVGLVSPAAPGDFLPKCPRGILFASVLGGEPSDTRRETLLSARVDHVETCNRLEHMQLSGRAPVVAQPAMYRQSSFSWFLVGFYGFSRWFHGFSWFMVGSYGTSR